LIAALFILVAAFFAVSMQTEVSVDVGDSYIGVGMKE
jgi:hypothetical protein